MTYADKTPDTIADLLSSKQRDQWPPLRRHMFGFWEFSDKPPASDLAAYYAGSYYQSQSGNYRKNYSPSEIAYLEAKIAQKVDLAHSIRGTDAPGSLLDVGCGEGFTLKFLSSKGWKVKGLEHSKEGASAINPAMAPYIQEGDLFDSLNTEITSGNHYDIVWLVNVLEHVIDPVHLMEKLINLVAEKGVLVVTVPNDGTDYHQLLEDNGLVPHPFWVAYPDHLSYFDVASLEHIAHATGWKVQNMIGDFPIDLFLANEASNYVTLPEKGTHAHRARVLIENLINQKGAAPANKFFGALADVGLGRNLTTFLTPAVPLPPKEPAEPEAHDVHDRDSLSQSVQNHSREPEELEAVGTYRCLKLQKISLGSYHVRPVTINDINSIRIWRNRQLDILRQKKPITIHEQEIYYSQEIWPDQKTLTPRNILMSYFKEDQLIGYGGLVHIDWDHKRAEMSYLLDPDFHRSDKEERILFLTYIRLMKRLAFEVLDFGRIFTETYDIRHRHIAILEEGGFKLEGRLKHHILIDNTPIDSLIHGCLFDGNTDIFRKIVT